MACPTENYHISVSVDYLEGEKASQAEFLWADKMAPRDTYTIALNDNTSVRLDSYFPARPHSIVVNDTEQHPAIIAEIMGDELAEALVNAKYIGMVLLDMEINREMRLKIARTQLISPSTPFKLRHGLETFLHTRRLGPASPAK